MRKILENLELILTAAGLLVVFLAHVLFEGTGQGSWKLPALTAMAVGVIHGVIFWLVRKRQRRIRREALGEVEHMLKDIINNQLCVISVTVDLQQNNSIALQDAHARATRSIARIQAALNDITEESLNLWKTKYAQERAVPAVISD